MAKRTVVKSTQINTIDISEITNESIIGIGTDRGRGAIFKDSNDTFTPIYIKYVNETKEENCIEKGNLFGSSFTGIREVAEYCMCNNWEIVCFDTKKELYDWIFEGEK